MNKRQLLYIKSIYEMKRASEQKRKAISKRAFNAYLDLNQKDTDELNDFIINHFGNLYKEQK